MEFFKRFGYRVISLEQYYQIRNGQSQPKGKEIVLTCDDGNYTFSERAYPILKPYQFPVTLFVVSESIKRQLHGSMSEDRLKELLKTGWIEVASHSKTHPLLSRLEENQIIEELSGSKRDLEKMFDRPIHFFAYPSGDLDERVTTAAMNAGYQMAFTTSYKKLQGLEEGPYTTTRLKISRTSDNPFAYWFKISGIYQFFKRQRYHWKYGWTKGVEGIVHKPIST